MLEYQKSRGRRTALGPVEPVVLRRHPKQQPLPARRALPGWGDFWYSSMSPSRVALAALRLKQRTGAKVRNGAYAPLQLKRFR
jgi:hypothetical protein